MLLFLSWVTNYLQTNYPILLNPGMPPSQVEARPTISSPSLRIPGGKGSMVFTSFRFLRNFFATCMKSGSLWARSKSNYEISAISQLRICARSCSNLSSNQILRFGVFKQSLTQKISIRSQSCRGTVYTNGNLIISTVVRCALEFINWIQNTSF